MHVLKKAKIRVATATTLPITITITTQALADWKRYVPRIKSI